MPEPMTRNDALDILVAIIGMGLQHLGSMTTTGSDLGDDILAELYAEPLMNAINHLGIATGEFNDAADRLPPMGQEYTVLLRAAGFTKV